jgi:hypothetical protein
MVTDGIIAGHLSAGALAAPGRTPTAFSAARFEEAHGQAVARLQEAAPDTSNPAATFLNPLLNLDASSTRLAETPGLAGLEELKPSQLMMLTMRSHEFLFNCQLVANVANRSSDGVQQLFRQQS